MMHLACIVDSTPQGARRSAAIALVGLAIVVANLFDRDGVVGDIVLPALGIATLLSSAVAFLAGVVALLREREWSVGTILATLAGAFLCLLMMSELFIQG